MRSKRSKSSEALKEYMLGMRVTKAEKDTIEKIAIAHGMSVSCMLWKLVHAGVEIEQQKRELG